MQKHYLPAFCLIAFLFLTIGASNKATAQTADRCEAAIQLLRDAKRSGMAQDQIDYLRTITQSDACARQKTRAPKTPATKARAPVKSKPPKVILPTGPFSQGQCSAATARLAKLQEARKSEMPDGQIQYAIWSSRDCTSRRQKGALNVAPGMTEMNAKLKAANIDVNALTKIEIEKCKSSSSSEDDRRLCSLNARLVAYSAAVNQMNANSRNKYKSNMRAYKAKMAKTQQKKREYRDNKAAYDKSMREWRRAVALCNQGKREYCAAQ